MDGGDSLREQQKALTRTRIIRAARRCFLSEGVADTSFDDIARHAAVSRATVYLHYPRKEALLLGIVQDDWAAQAALFDELPASAENSDDFARWLKLLTDAYRARREFMGLYALALGQDSAVAALLDEQRRVLLGILGERFNAFDLARDASPAKRVAAYLMLSQIEQFCLMSLDADWDDAIAVGIGIVASRLAAFVREAA